MSEHVPIAIQDPQSDEIGIEAQINIIGDLMIMCGDVTDEEYRSTREAMLKIVCTDPAEFAAAREELEAEWRGDPKPPSPTGVYR